MLQCMLWPLYDYCIMLAGMSHANATHCGHCDTPFAPDDARHESWGDIVCGKCAAAATPPSPNAAKQVPSPLPNGVTRLVATSTTAARNLPGMLVFGSHASSQSSQTSATRRALGLANMRGFAPGRSADLGTTTLARSRNVNVVSFALD
jgi:hypothetical protein